jgi:hypothetical protein
MEPMRIDMGLMTPGDEAWRVEFKVNDGCRQIWIDNVSRGIALQVYVAWQQQGAGEMVSCTDCPEGVSDCRHGRSIWKYREMTDMRIMPMREAV